MAARFRGQRLRGGPDSLVQRCAAALAIGQRSPYSHRWPARPCGCALVLSAEHARPCVCVFAHGSGRPYSACPHRCCGAATSRRSASDALGGARICGIVVQWRTSADCGCSPSSSAPLHSVVRLLGTAFFCSFLPPPCNIRMQPYATQPPFPFEARLADTVSAPVNSSLCGRF